jgi:hypothetical protein
LRRFAEQHLRGKDIDPPTKVQDQTNVQRELFSQMRWVQVDEQGVVGACVQAVCDLTRAAAPAVPWADITLLVRTHNLGLRCVEELKARGIEVAHVFGRTHKEKKTRKLGFWMGDARMKAATVHSFKGWESRAMVVQVGRAATPAERAAIYVALSRLKGSPAGSFLTVVCSSPELESYGRTWPAFESGGVAAQV